MRTRTAWIGMAMVFGLGWSANRVFSQDGGMEGKKPAEEKPAPKEPTAEEKEAMAAWMKAMTPGEQHKKLAAQDGNWESVGKMWEKADQPPTEFKGTAKFRMIFGGRYQVQDVSSEMMGMPFEGMGLTGYDNVKKKYFSTWIDSMGTGIMVSEGTADEKGVITFNGPMCDPVSGKDCKTRMVFTDKDKDNFSFEMFVDKGDGKGEAKCMEMAYTRSKDKK
jgi:hypothetical protein